MDTHEHLNEPHPEDGPEEGPEDDCPVCYGEIGTPAPLCPNGHNVCDTCRPHILGGDPPRCPICRACLRHIAHPLIRRIPAPARPLLVNGQPDPFADARPLQDVGGLDALGRAGGGRPHNGPVWNARRREFLEARERGEIPATAVFGGIHTRKCGHRGCQRQAGAGGVRFLLFAATGKRRYRCEAHTG